MIDPQTPDQTEPTDQELIQFFNEFLKWCNETELTDEGTPSQKEAFEKLKLLPSRLAASNARVEELEIEVCEYGFLLDRAKYLFDTVNLSKFSSWKVAKSEWLADYSKIKDGK